MANASTPTCPACDAKFSHDHSTLRCKKCGLPDEIRDAGPQVIRAWQKGKLPHATRQPQVDFSDKRGAKLSKRRNRHGRRGVHTPGSPSPVHAYRQLARKKRRENAASNQ